MDLMFSLSSADSLSAVASGPRTRREAAKLVGVGLVLLAIVTQAGCGKKSTAAPTPSPVRAQPTVESAKRPAGPASEPQFQHKLPPPQPIPPEALADEPTTLRVERTLPPIDEEIGPREEIAPPAEKSVAPTAEPTPNPRSPFRLGVIISERERAQYNSMIDRDLSVAERSLARVLTGGRLQERSAQVKRVRAFMRQAEEVRGDDLPLAKNLAGRARLLAEDLAGDRR